MKNTIKKQKRLELGALNILFSTIVTEMKNFGVQNDCDLLKNL